MAFKPRFLRVGLFAFSAASLGGILKAINVPGNIERHATKELQVYLVPIEGNQGPAIRGVSKGGLDCSDQEWCLLFVTDRRMLVFDHADNF